MHHRFIVLVRSPPPPQNLCHYRHALETRTYVTTSTILLLFFRSFCFHFRGITSSFFFFKYYTSLNYFWSYSQTSFDSFIYFSLLLSFLISSFCSSFARFMQLATNIIKENIKKKKKKKKRLWQCIQRTENLLQCAILFFWFTSNINAILGWNLFFLLLPPFLYFFHAKVIRSNFLFSFPLFRQSIFIFLFRSQLVATAKEKKKIAICDVILKVHSAFRFQLGQNDLVTSKRKPKYDKIIKVLKYLLQNGHKSNNNKGSNRSCPRINLGREWCGNISTCIMKIFIFNKNLVRILLAFNYAFKYVVREKIKYLYIFIVSCQYTS